MKVLQAAGIMSLYVTLAWPVPSYVVCIPTMADIFGRRETQTISNLDQYLV